MKKSDPVAAPLRDALEEEARPQANDDVLLTSAIDRAMAKLAADEAAVPAPRPTAERLALVSRPPAGVRARAVRFAIPLAAAFAATVAFAAIYAVSRAPRSEAPAESAPPVPTTEEALRSPAPAPAPVAVAEAPSMNVGDLPSVPSGTRALPVVKADAYAGMSASDLFRDANAARRAGDVPKATELYRALEAHHPGAAETSAARVSLGRMLLDRGGDPAGALAEFDGYLKGTPRDGTLAEEARVGRALALQRLGRAADERRAWQDLLEQHPASLYADRARARLTALGDAP